MDFFITTTVTISQVLAAVVIGAAASSSVPSAKKTFRDFSYIVSTGGFACLLFSHMATSLSADLMQRSSVLLVFASLGIFVGYLCAVLFGRVFYRPSGADRGGSQRHPELEITVDFPKGLAGIGRVVVEYAGESGLPDEEIVKDLEAPLARFEEYVGYQTLAKTACCLQNATVLPLSLVSRLGVSPAVSSWFNADDATTYIFVYNVVVSTVFWSWGFQATAGGAKVFREMRAIRLAIERYRTLTSRRSVSVTTPLRHPILRHGRRDQMECNAEVLSRPYLDDRQGEEDDDALLVIRRVKSKKQQIRMSGSPNTASVKKRIAESLRAAFSVVVQSLQSPPFAGTLLGMFVGVTPALHGLIDTEPFASAASAISLAGGCAVPGSLLLLGASLAGNSISFDAENVRMRHASQQTSPDGPMSSVAECYLSASFSRNTAAMKTTFEWTAEDGTDEATASSEEDHHTPGWMGKALTKVRGNFKYAWRYAKFLFNLDGVSHAFVFGIAAVRLVLVPVICFVLVGMLSRGKVFASIAEPRHNTMLVTLLILCAAPTSITVVMMCNVQQFMVRPVSKMLFYQYFLTIPSCMLWLTVALWMTS
jgi:predicted permease